jgi:hypothetical protein
MKFSLNKKYLVDKPINVNIISSGIPPAKIKPTKINIKIFA